MRAGMAASALMAGVVLALLLMVVRNGELKAAEIKATSPVTAGAAPVTKTHPLRGKNVNAEPSGIALPADSRAASVDESEAENESSAVKEQAAPAKKHVQKKAVKRRVSKPVPVAKKARPEILDDEAPLPKKAVPSVATASSSLREAQTFVESGDYNTAIAIYDNALDKDGNNQEAWEGKALALQQSASPGAIEQLREMVSEKPFSGSAHAALAQALMKQDNNDAALTFWQRAVELEPANKTYKLSLAVLHDRMGHDAEALKLYREMGSSLPYAAQKRLEALESKAR